MYVVMRVFNDFTTPEIIFSTEDRAIQYVQEQESVFCSYCIKYIELGDDPEGDQSSVVTREKEEEVK